MLRGRRLWMRPLMTVGSVSSVESSVELHEQQIMMAQKKSGACKLYFHNLKHCESLLEAFDAPSKKFSE